MNTLHLYNHWHYGDIFLSRMLIKGLSEKYKIKFYHNLKTGLFEDLPFVEEIIGVPKDFNLHYTNLKDGIINTWIGQNGMYYIKNIDSPGCSFKNYMKMIEDILRHYNLGLKEKEFYLPEIIYEKLSNFEEIKNNFYNLKQKYKKCVLISNGEVMSRQSYNFDFSPIIIELANNYPDYLFLITKNFDHNKENIVYTGSLTNKTPDLLHISYFSKLSEVLIGRASSPYTYFMTKENIFDKYKTIISFNNTRNEGVFYENLSPKFIWSNNYNLENVYSTIKNNL